jgi:hypothetical protein
MDRLAKYLCSSALLTLLSITSAGCATNSNAENGALVGGLGGAGAGALIGSTVGKAGPGALIGGAVGAMTGAVVGNSVDESEARNRALIEAKLHRQIAGAATVDDVITMVRSGVPEDVVVNHVRYHGMARPLEPSDYVALQQQQVSPNIVRTMQEFGHPQHETVVVEAPPPGYYYRDPYYDPYWGPHYYHGGPRVGVGFTFR